MATTVLPAACSASARAVPPLLTGYKVDISRGERIGRVSSEWFSRPDDERFLSLSALYAAVRARAKRATARTIETKALRVETIRVAHEAIVARKDEGWSARSPSSWRIGRQARAAAIAAAPGIIDMDNHFAHLFGRYRTAAARTSIVA